MSFEMMAFDGLRKPAKGSKKVCGCRMEQSAGRGRRIESPFAPTGPWTPRGGPGTPIVVCPGVRRFTDRMTARKLLALENAKGSFCVYVKRGKRCKTGKRRVNGRCVTA